MIRFAMNPKDTELFFQIYYKVSTYINKQDAFYEPFGGSFILGNGSYYKQFPVADSHAFHKNAAGGPASVYSAGKKSFTNSEFRRFLDALGEGLIVKHKKLGEGVVVEIRGDKAVIQFGDEQRLYELKEYFVEQIGQMEGVRVTKN